MDRHSGFGSMPRFVSATARLPSWKRDEQPEHYGEQMVHEASLDTLALDTPARNLMMT